MPRAWENPHLGQLHTDIDAMRRNLEAHCIPTTMLGDVVSSLEDFLEQRRGLMALTIKRWFESL